MRILSTRLLLVLVAPLLPLLGACRATVEAPSTAGSYKSTKFILPGPTDGPDDVAARGGFITLRLNPDGTTSGQQHIPGEPGNPADTDLRGSYTVAGDTIRFDIAAGSVLAAEPMILEGDRIRTQQKLRRGPFEIVLDRVATP